MKEGITEEMVRCLARARTRDLTTEEEAIGWLCAARFGLTDDIGGMEWQHRCEEGLVSDEAQRLLYRINPAFRPLPDT